MISLYLSLPIPQGTGASCIYLAQQGYDVVGVDLVPEAVAACRQRASQAGLEPDATLLSEEERKTYASAVGQRAATDPNAASASSAGSCTFLQGDALRLPHDRAAFGAAAGYDLAFDCQCFHVLRQVDEAAAVATLRHLVRPGGRLIVLTGNADEAEVGPSVLTADELRAAFAPPYWCCRSLQADRFDMTQFYAKLPQPPLAWVGVFERMATDR